MSDDARDEAYRAFTDAVNMTKGELRTWLDTDESRSVALLDKKKADLDDDDIAQLKRVAGYVHRHLAQRPGKDVEHSRWRYSLMNWGHDPLKS